MAAAELDIGVADGLGDDGSVGAGKIQHLVRHVDADNAALGPHDLGGDEADLAAARAEVEHDVALAHVAGWVAAAVVAVKHLLRDDLEILRVVIDRAAQRGLHGLRAGGIAFLHALADVCIGDDLRSMGVKFGQTFRHGSLL